MNPGLFGKISTNDVYSHKSKVHCVSWNANGELLASGSNENLIRIWDLNHNSGFTLEGHKGSVESLAWDKSNPSVLASASSDKTVKLWDQRIKEPYHTIETSGENINICWNSLENLIAVGSKDNILSFVDLNKIETVRKFTYDYEINELTWDNEGKYLFLTTEDGYVLITDKLGENSLYKLKAHTSNCYCIKFSPRGDCFATGSADTTVNIWDKDELICTNSIQIMNWPIRSLGFSFDGAFVASGSEDKFILICSTLDNSYWKIENKFPLNTLSWHPSKYALAYASEDLSVTGKIESIVKVLKPEE